MRLVHIIAAACLFAFPGISQAGQMQEMCTSRAMTIPVTKRLTELAFYEALSERSLPAHYRTYGRHGEQITTLRALRGSNGSRLLLSVKLIGRDGVVSTLVDEGADGSLDRFVVAGEVFRISLEDQRDFCLYMAGVVAGSGDTRLRSGRGY